jgi:hypothetical protein
MLRGFFMFVVMVVVGVVTAVVLDRVLRDASFKKRAWVLGVALMLTCLLMVWSVRMPPPPSTAPAQTYSFTRDCYEDDAGERRCGPFRRE